MAPSGSTGSSDNSSTNGGGGSGGGINGGGGNGGGGGCFGTLDSVLQYNHKHGCIVLPLEGTAGETGVGSASAVGDWVGRLYGTAAFWSV